MKRSISSPEIVDMEDKQLISGCRAGDKQCQRMLFKKYRNRVFSIICHALSPYVDTDDIVQQVFIKIYRSLDNFKGLASLDTWIYRITLKVCIDQQRKKYRKRQLKIIYNPDILEIQQDVKKPNPYIEHEQKELSDQILKGLDKLSPEKRVVVTMFEMEGFSLEDISTIIQKPIGTIKSRLFHGRKELAAFLRKYLD